MRTSWKRIGCYSLSVFFLLLGICAVFFVSYYTPEPEALEAFTSDSNVTVTLQQDYLLFEPEDITAGLIFYPGGKVDYLSYAPLLHQLASHGIVCIDCRMPLNMAFLGMNRADHARDLYPEVTHWFLAGHSLGGAMASSYLSSHKESYDGLVLLAAYSTSDLSDSSLRVLSLYGDQDGVLNRKNYASYYPNLPASTEESIIAGGCHAWFGSYGPQKGDGIPEITPEEQQAAAVDRIVSFIFNK